MARVKGGTVSRARRNKVLKKAKGYFGSKHRLYKKAQEQEFKGGLYSFRDRKKNKGNFRKIWITRINAACRANDVSYSRFIDGLSKAGIEINRKMLSELAISDIKAFDELIQISKNALEGKIDKKEEKSEDSKKIVAEKEVKSDLSKLTVTELKKLAKDKNIDGYTTLKKAELISALK